MVGEAEATGSWRACHARWPTVTLSLQTYLEAVARTGPVMHLDGLFLATACAGNCPSAHAVFEAEVLTEVKSALSRLGLGPSAVDEAMQAARDRLLVGLDGEPPRISRYTGRGPLVAWVRTTAVRLAVDAHRADKNTISADDDLEHLPSGVDAELALIRLDYRVHFESAFQAVLASLTPRQRALLRLSLVDRLSIDQLCVLYQTSRASVARWLASAKEELATGTRRELGKRLQLPREELETMMTTLISRLDVSVARFLNEADKM